MGEVIAFPKRPTTATFGPDETAALDRLVDRMRDAGAIGWEADGARAYVLGAEDETLLIVAKGAAGIVVRSGIAHELLWRGDRLPGYA